MSLWGDIATGVAGVAGYALGGPAGAALLGGIVGGVAAGFESGWDWKKMAEGAALGAVGGLVGGGFGGVAFKTLGVKAGLGLMKTSFVAGAKNFGITSLRTTGLKAAFPAAWHASQVGLRTKSGLIASGLTAFNSRNWPQMVRDKISAHEDVPPPTLGEIKLIDISPGKISAIPDGMLHVMMPDPKQLPDGLVLSPVIEGHYQTLPQMYLGNWQTIGDGPYTPPPEKQPASEIKGAETAQVANYPVRVEILSDRYGTLRAADARVAAVVGETGELCKTARDSVNALMEMLNEMAGTHPANTHEIAKFVESPDYGLIRDNLVDPSGITEDSYVLALVESSMLSSENAMNAIAEEFEANAADVDGETPDGGETTDDGEGADDTGADSTETPNSTEQDTVTNQTPTVTPVSDSSAPPSWEWDSGQGGTTGSEVDGSDGAESNPKKTETTSPAANSEPDTTAASPTNTPAAAVSANPTSGTANIVPALLAMGSLGNASRNSGKRDSNGDESDDNKDDNKLGAGGRPGGAPAAGQPAASTQPAAAAPAQQAAASPARVSATPVSAMAASVRAPSEDGSVIYTFPDGRTQRVSAVVAHALDAAFGNAAATDARQAYAKTGAAVPPDQVLGLPVDPYQLMTGDVASWREPIPGDVEAWRETLALVVVFGTDVSSNFEMIVDGEMRLFASDAGGKAGNFGPFAGFLHPSGIEIATAAPDAAVQAAPVPADPSGGASVVLPA